MDENKIEVEETKNENETTEREEVSYDDLMDEDTEEEREEDEEEEEKANAKTALLVGAGAAALLGLGTAAVIKKVRGKKADPEASADPNAPAEEKPKRGKREKIKVKHGRKLSMLERLTGREIEPAQTVENPTTPEEGEVEETKTEDNKKKKTK